MKPHFSDLRERLLVQKKELADDDFGGFSETWTDHKQVWAKVEFASSKDITTRPLKDLLQGTGALRKSIYRVVLRTDEAMPVDIRFVRKGKILQAISQPIAVGTYTTIFACEP